MMKTLSTLPFLLSTLLLSACAHFNAADDSVPTQRDELRNPTPLVKAAAQGQLEEVEQRLREGSDINETSAGGVTALMVAARKGHHKVVQYLITSNALISQQDE
jgi:ankyrin repeat protein